MLDKLLRRRRPAPPPTEPQSPHPDRACGPTCDITDADHDGVVFLAAE